MCLYLNYFGSHVCQMEYINLIKINHYLCPHGMGWMGCYSRNEGNMGTAKYGELWILIGCRNVAVVDYVQCIIN